MDGAVSLNANTKQAMNSHPTKPTAFTLLEVLLGMVLSIALMSGLWASLNLYTKIFSSGHAEVEQAQLIQGLLSKLSLELRAAVPPPKQEESSSTSSANDPLGQLASTSLETSSSRGLRGEAHWIEIDLVLPLLVTSQNSDTEDPASRGVNTPGVPELATVRYYIAEPDLVTPVTDGTSSDEVAGLVRFARPWGGHPGAEEANSMTVFGSSSQGLDGYSAITDALAAGTDPASELLMNSQDKHAPQLLASEVSQLEFRYFDGQFWASQWDSRTSGSLPLAVEVAVAIPRPSPPTTTAEDSFSADASTDMRGVSLFEDADTSFRTGGEQLPWIISRRLVALPLGTKPTEASSTTDDDAAPMDDPLPSDEASETEDPATEVAP